MRDASEMDPADLHPVRRRQLGAWYTPAPLVEAVVSAALARFVPRGSIVRVLDPACGDGRFLVEAARQLAELGLTARLTGIDIDPDTAAATRKSLGRAATIVCADALTRAWGTTRFDLVVGNPPFLSQMSSATSRGGRSAFGGGAYADVAADFLALATGLAHPRGGRVGLVLPLSLIVTRDAGPIRTAVLRQATLDWFWWSPTTVFDAQVRTCALGLIRPSGGGRAIRRQAGKDFAPWSDLPFERLGDDDDGWSGLIRDQLGVPEIAPLTSVRLLGDVATVTADFRDQYYGLVGAVGDGMDGPPLVTSGLIDPGRCWWGERPIRFAKQSYAAPRVDLGLLSTRLQAWAVRRLVPKVLVASQTKVIEAVADPGGRWLPGVPVVSVIPTDPSDVWWIAALLTSPVASAWLAAQMAGSGMSAAAMRVPAAVLARLPMPTGSLEAAIGMLRCGDVSGCGRAMIDAYGLDDPDDRLFEWWRARIEARSA